MPRRRPPSSRRPLKLQQLEARCVLDASGLRITEFMASNDDTLEDFEGDSSDWIEVYNPSASEVSLEGLYLTDDDDELTKWRFPAGASIEPGGFLVVFASDKDLVAPNGEHHTNFKLSAGGEYLGLIAADGFTVIDAFAPEFPAQEEDVSYGVTMASSVETLVAEGDTARAWVPTSGVHDATWTGVGFNDNLFNLQGPTGFGYENSSNPNPNYENEFSTEVGVGTTSLYMRITFDVDSLSGIDGLALRMKYDDGFVAYLNGVEIASANAPASPAWNSTAITSHDDFEAISFQEFDASAAIPLLIDGENVLAIHALNVSSGSSDFLMTPELVASRSAIVSPEELGYFEDPTPGRGNGEAFAGFAAEPTFSVPHGFYTSTQLVALASATQGALIVYTTDGSTPAVDANLTPTNGTAYSGPIAVSGTTTLRAIAFKQDYKPSFVQSASYLFLDDVVDQSPTGQAPSGWPNFNVNGQLLDYGIDPDIIAQYGEQAVKDSLAAVPTIALTTDVENLFDASTGIYVNALNRGRDWERAASVELINPDGSEGFSTNAGLRIRGGYGRNDFNPKHAFRLYFRGEYGDGMLNYPLFGEDGTDEFDVLDLRTSSNYSWAAWGQSFNGLQNSYLREVFARDTQADMGHPHTRSNYYHLYLNGQYWGLYMTQERVQEHFGESYFGGDQEEYDVVKSDAAEAYTTEIADGTDVAWRQLYEYAQQLADNPSSNANNYWTMQGLNPDGSRNDGLEVLLDVDNLVDYMMIIIYTGGHDTGISAFLGNDRANNWFGIRNRVTGDEGFQFFLHDNEHSLGTGELTGSLHGTLDIDRTGPFYTPLDDDYDFFNPVYLHQDLLNHPEYVQRFVDRVQELTSEGGVLTPDANIARMTERADQVEGAIIAEAARWGDARRATPYDKEDWENEVEWLLETYFPTRHDLVLGQLQNDGLYLSAPTFSQPEGAVPSGTAVTVTNTLRGGTVYYTTDGMDPRAVGGGLNPSSNVMSGGGPVIVTGDTVVMARAQATNGSWSGLVVASYSVESLPGDYDQNGVVEQADYTVWRETYGSTTDLRADGNGDLIVDAADYSVWRDAMAMQPVLVNAAAANAPTTSGVASTLSVLGGAGIGEESLVYNWSVTGPGQVSFSSNGGNASKNTVATFSEAGEYLFSVSIESPGFASVVTSNVAVTVQQAVSGVAIDPADPFVAAGFEVQLSAVEVDQFGAPMGAAGGAVWSVSGGGNVDQSGVYSAPSSAGSAQVSVRAAPFAATATLDVVSPATWYQADSNSGIALINSGTTGGNGRVVGSAGWSSGVSGNALLLTGGQVELPSGLVSGHDDITIATWINLDSVDTWSRVFDFGSGTGVNMFFTPEAGFDGGPMRFSIKPSGQGEQQIDGPSLSAGQWRHIAVTIGGDVGSLYVDGVLVGTNTGMTFNPSDLGVTTQNYLGDSQYTADPPLFGRIDDFRIYGEALPAEQIAQLAGASSLSMAAASAAPTADPNAATPNLLALFSVSTTNDKETGELVASDDPLTQASEIEQDRRMLLLGSYSLEPASESDTVAGGPEGPNGSVDDAETVDLAFAMLGEEENDPSRFLF